MHHVNVISLFLGASSVEHLTGRGCILVINPIDRCTDAASIASIHEEFDHAPRHHASLSNLIHFLPAHFLPSLPPTASAMHVNSTRMKTHLIKITPGPVSPAVLPPRAWAATRWRIFLWGGRRQTGASLIDPIVCHEEAGSCDAGHFSCLFVAGVRPQGKERPCRWKERRAFPPSSSP